MHIMTCSFPSRGEQYPHLGLISTEETNRDGNAAQKAQRLGRKLGRKYSLCPDYTQCLDRKWEHGRKELSFSCLLLPFFFFSCLALSRICRLDGSSSSPLQSTHLQQADDRRTITESETVRCAVRDKWINTQSESIRYATGDRWTV